MDQPIPNQRQAGEGSQSWKRAIVAPERHHLPTYKQASLLTNTSWDSGWSTSTGRVAARDQLPRRDTWHTWEGAPVVHPGNWAAGMGEAISQSPQLGQLRSPSTWLPELLRPGKDTKCMPNQVCALVEYPRSWIWAAQTWEVHEIQGPLWIVPLQSNLEPEQCRPGKHMLPWASANTGWSIYCEYPPTHQWYLFAVFLPLNTTEHVSLNKWPPSPPFVKAEIRHWRDLQTEEAKINKEEGTTLALTRATD